MKVLLVFACFLVYANAVSFYEVVSDEWVTWKLFHGKNFSNPVEDKFRLKIFMENKAKIAKHNAMAHQGDRSYFLKMNSYGDLVSSYSCKWGKCKVLNSAPVTTILSVLVST